MKQKQASLIAALLGLSACASVPQSSATNARATVPASAQAQASRAARAPALSLVSYAQSGAVTVVSSAPPTVERLASGRWLVTFAPEAAPLAAASPAPAK